jgi:mRNA-degrading endonuclease RelE of RelBE toxin-antitoxin system
VGADHHLGVTYSVVWEIQAAGALRRLREENAAGAAWLTAAIEALAEDPRPPNAVPMGGSGWYRLRLGPYRAVYELLPDKNAVRITNVGRVPPERERRP